MASAPTDPNDAVPPDPWQSENVRQKIRENGPEQTRYKIKKAASQRICSCFHRETRHKIKRHKSAYTQFL